MLKSYLSPVLKIALTAALFWYLLGQVDIGAAWDEARGVDGWLLAAAGLCLLVQVPLGVVRWRSVLKAMAAPLPFRSVFAIYYLGCFFNLALPSSVGGDAVRMWKARRAGLALDAAVHSVMLERAFTVLGLLLLVAAMQPVLAARVGAVPGAWVFPLLLAAGLAGVAVLTMLDHVPERLRRWRLLRIVVALGHDARRVFLSRRWSPRILGWVLIGHVNLAATVWLLGLGLHLDVSLLDCVVLVPPVILVTTLPISVSGWGVRETAMVTAFALVGVPAHSALVMSVLFGLLVIVTSLPGGLFWLGGRRAEAVGEATPDRA